MSGKVDTIFKMKEEVETEFSERMAGMSHYVQYLFMPTTILAEAYFFTPVLKNLTCFIFILEY